MPIEGDLKSLNISSVMQLISQDRLTGIFRVKSKNEVVVVGFSEGQVTGAFYERGEKVERLETYLVRSGLVGKNVYEMVEEIHNETKRPIINILLEDKYLTMEEVERIITFKIQEVFDDIFARDQGEFKFDQGAVMYPKSVIKMRMNTERLILESARRMDEWPKIKKEIPSGDVVYKKVDRPELKLKPSKEEARVLAVLDGHRSVDDLVEISGLGRFHTYNCLYRLLSTGQIAFAYAKPTAKPSKPKRQLSLKSLVVPLRIAAVIIILIIEFLLGNYFVANRIFSFDLVSDEFCESDYKNYQKIFFYKHNQIPSISEVEDIFSN